MLWQRQNNIKEDRRKERKKKEDETKGVTNHL
jgi:hypothetical protein